MKIDIGILPLVTVIYNFSLILGVWIHLHVVMPFLQRETTFMTSCLTSRTKKLFQNRAVHKGSGWKEGKNENDICFSLKCIHLNFSIMCQNTAQDSQIVDLNRS